MAEASAPTFGEIGWLDLTVSNATEIRDFYQEVMGWTVQEIPIGEYNDFAMVSASGKGVAGVCHAAGANADQPPGWMVYILVPDLDRSLASSSALGGTTVGSVRTMEDGSKFAVLRDPAGSMIALFQPRASSEAS